MKISASFYNRPLTQLIAPPAVTLRVEQYSMHVLGGPQKARIVATGREEDLWDCISLLRCGVELYDERGDVVWWGYVDDVRINMDSAEWGVSVQDMANTVAVAYTTQEGILSTAGNRRSTTLAQNTGSIAEYGERQIILTANNIDEAGANAMRDQALATVGWPMPTSDLSEGSGAKAVILCRGWYDTLGWKYYGNPLGVNGHIATPDVYQNIGDNVTEIETVWTLPAGSDTFDTIGLFFYRSLYGFPVMDLSCRIHNGSNQGAPLLATFTITPADITATDGGAGGYIEKALSAPVTASTSPLCIAIRNLSANDLTNHYRLGCTGTIHPYSSTQFKDTGSWAALPYDPVFKFTRKDNIVSQIQAMLTGTGQFLTGIDTEGASTIATNPYRNGDATAKTQIEELIELHTGSTGRLAIEVTRDRRARIYTEPDVSSPIYVDRYMTPYNAGGAPIERHFCPYGYWASLKEVLPATGVGGGSDAASGAVGFIESADYNVAQERWTPRFRKNKNAFAGRQ
jgi:hypothetical protein